MSNLINVAAACHAADSQNPSSVNDVHSQLNRTPVRHIVDAHTVSDIITALNTARTTGTRVAVAGGRHAMGGQQFLTNATVIDTRSLNRVLHFDQTQGLVTVQAGTTWPQLIQYLKTQPADAAEPWTIIQKQTGCNEMTIGGSIGSNVHGRGLKMKPLVGDIVDIELVLPDGTQVRCDRLHNSDLFSHAVGGYGLFGIVTSATLRLQRHTALRRSVSLVQTDTLIDEFNRRIANGATYGDFQFAIDDKSDDFLRTGILSTYAPVGIDCPVEDDKVLLSVDQWRRLLWLAHTDKSEAFRLYKNHYLKTDGQLYRSDDFQLATYIANYHADIDIKSGHDHAGSEVISELNVPRPRLHEFLTEAAKILRGHAANVIYGTVRLIDADSETALPWAKDDYACTVLNLHTQHDDESIKHLSRCLRDLLDLVTSMNGTFYLTYHRFATRTQLLQAYPELPQFFSMKNCFDPQGVLSSDWYEHHKRLLAIA